MFAEQDLRWVLFTQELLRRDVEQQRLAARISKQVKSKAQTRRVFGLRLSLA